MSAARSLGPWGYAGAPLPLSPLSASLGLLFIRAHLSGHGPGASLTPGTPQSSPGACLFNANYTFAPRASIAQATLTGMLFPRRFDVSSDPSYSAILFPAGDESYVLTCNERG